MPDNDEFERRIYSCWRTPYRLAKHDGTPNEMAAACATAAAKMLRKFGGCMGFNEIAQVLSPFCRQSEQLELLMPSTAQEAFLQLEAIEEQHHNIYTSLAIREAKAICLQCALDIPVVGSPQLILSQRFVTALVESQLLEKLPLTAVMVRFDRHLEFKKWEEEVKEHLPEALKKLVSQVAQDPSCKQLPIPRSKVKRKTADLMKWAIPLP